VKRRIGLLATCVVSLAFVGIASAQTLGWHRVATAKDASEFYADASIIQTVNHARGLAIVSAATAPAKISGTVSCSKGFTFNSFNFTYMAKKTTHRLRVPVMGGDCQVMVDATLDNGGAVGIVLLAL